MHYAAGVLPVAWVDDEAYFLIGRDARDGLWSDFGGKCEKVDRDVASTAAREFWEETYGVIMDARAMRARLVPGGCIPLKARTQNSHPYWCFLVETPWTPHLRSAFAKQLAFLRGIRQTPSRVYIEKTDIAFVTWHELDTTQAFPKRGVFHATIAHHWDTLQAIVDAGPRGWQAACDAAAATYPLSGADSTEAATR